MSKFPKSERLSSKKLIEELFSSGASFNIPPLKVIYLKKPSASPVNNQVLISTSKKKFPRAIDRNKLKRRIREAYRLNKWLLEGRSQEFYLVIGYIYIGREIASYQMIDEKLKQTLLRLKEVIGR